MSRTPREPARGPFRADQLGPDDRYELSNGHAVYCAPTGQRGGRANLVGGEVLDTDPAVEEAGVDVGYAPEPGTLRAPDVAVGNVRDVPGWGTGVPTLALEYADIGQDEETLQHKIGDLLDRGTRLVWVARLAGPRRVEIYERGKDVRVAGSGARLEAPGVLANVVEVDALFDRRAAHEATFRNLLQRRGYSTLDDVRVEGREEGQKEGRDAALRASLHTVLRARGFEPTADAIGRIERADAGTLTAWIERAAVATTADEALR